VVGVNRYALAIVLGVAAVVLVAVGVYEWSQTRGGSFTSGHHYHPLRARILWLAGAVAAVAAVDQALRVRRGWRD
jgi:hypothetical protein